MTELRTLLYLVATLTIAIAAGYIWGSGLPGWARWFGCGYLALVWIVAVRALRRLE